MKQRGFENQPTLRAETEGNLFYIFQYTGENLC